MNEKEVVPGCMKCRIDVFHDRLCAVLTEWELGEISDFELYDFMRETAEKISNISYGDKCL